MILETLSMIGRNLLWQSALLATIVFCLLYILPRSQSTVRYKVALSGFFGTVLLLTLPFLPATSFGLSFAPDTLLPASPPLLSGTSGGILMGAANISENANISEIITLNRRPELPLGFLLVGIWLAGCLVALLRLGSAAWQGRKLARSCTSVDIERASTLSRKVKIVRSSNIKAPLVLGLLKPTIVVPLNFSLNLNNPETRIILEHEIAHIIRRDLWTNFAQRAVLAVLWWCLPLYWINRQIGLERENICDAIATAQIKQNSPLTDSPAHMLAHALVRFAEQKSNIKTPTLAIGIHPQAKLLARRVQVLCDSSPVPHLSKKLLLSTSLAIPAALLMLGAVTPRALAGSPPESIPLADKPVISAPLTTAEITPLLTSEVKVVPTIKIVRGRLTSKYGLARKKFDGKVHTGIDIANKPGTPIYAPAHGTIVEATDIYKNNKKWGKVVAIETKGGVQTVFAHLKNYNVTAGQTITAGEQIAQMGNTGASTGPHVHIETHIDGKHVDPLTVWSGLPN